MRTLVIEPTFEAWRDAARDLLMRAVPPGEILWTADAREAPLFAENEPVVAPPAGRMPKVSAGFLDMAHSAAAHSDPRRWGLLYQILWRTYYRNIFNLARLKVKAMQSEMPKKYWKNLPEAPLIAGLIADSRRRVDGMLAEEERPVKPAPKNAYLDHLRRLNQETPNTANEDP